MMNNTEFGWGNPQKRKARKSGFALAGPVQKNDSGGVDIKVDSKF
jgi:hypothetical protein